MISWQDKNLKKANGAETRLFMDNRFKNGGKLMFFSPLVYR